MRPAALILLMLLAPSCRAKEIPPPESAPPPGKPAPDGRCPAEGAARITDVEGVYKVIGAMAWTGSELGVAWHNAVETPPSAAYLTRVEPGGAVIGTVEIDRQDRLHVLDVEWTGSEYAVFWASDAIRMKRLDASGVEVGVAEIGGKEWIRAADAAWTGSAFGLAWQQEGDGQQLLESNVRFVILSPEGEATGDADALESSFAYHPRLAWSGSRFGMAWQEEEGVCGTPGHVDPSCISSIWFQERDGAGTRIGKKQPVTGGTHDASDVRIAWSGSLYGLVWQDESAYWNECPPRCHTFELYFAAIDPAAQPSQRKNVRLTLEGGYMPNMAWAGSGFALAWARGSGRHLFKVVDASGKELCPECDLTGSARYGYTTGMAWTGSAAAVSWVEGGDGQAVLGFPGCGG